MERIIELSQSNENGNYFLKLLKEEQEKLERLVTKAECVLENGRNLPEEVSGKLRIAAGKAKLLMRQKFHQFEDLCRKNMETSTKDHFSVTNEDLAGYWDVVMIQISQVHDVFEESCGLMNDRRQV